MLFLMGGVAKSSINISVNVAVTLVVNLCRYKQTDAQTPQMWLEGLMS